MTRRVLLLAVVLGLPSWASAGGVSLLDAAGAKRGTAVLALSRGLVQLKIAGLPPLPAATGSGADAFTATTYKAYLSSSAERQRLEQRVTELRVERDHLRYLLAGGAATATEVEACDDNLD